MAGVGDSEDGAQRPGAEGPYQDCGRPARAILRPHIHARELRGTARRVEVNHVFRCTLKKLNELYVPGIGVCIEMKCAYNSHVGQTMYHLVYPH